MSKYVWCEDSGAGYAFWKLVFSSLYKDMVVESKGNISDLCKALRNVDDNHKYYLCIDNAVDNPEVMREIQRIYYYIGNKDNVKLVNVYSFEFALLSFAKLEEWVFAANDELKESRRNLLAQKNLVVEAISSGMESNNLSIINEMIQNANVEQFCAKLLFEITRNTGFATTKGQLGNCFWVDCCTWSGKKDDDICGLETNYLSQKEKIKDIVRFSVIKDALTKAGL